MVPAHGDRLVEDRKEGLVLVLGEAVKLDAPNARGSILNQNRRTIGIEFQIGIGFDFDSDSDFNSYASTRQPIKFYFSGFKMRK